MKIAVFLSGPIRYADRVINKIESLNPTFDFDFFVHLWEDDKTDKARIGTSNLMGLIDNPMKVKSLTIEKALDMESIVDKYGEWTDTHSHVSSMFGMFSAINKLIKILSADIDYEAYTHVLRLRTDVALLGDDFFNNIDFKNDYIYIAKNFVINDTWISDHIMLAKVKTFRKIWEYKNFYSFEKKFSYYARNPEFYLKHKVSTRNLVNKWVRYEDYHIVYNPVKDSDPELFKEVYDAGGIEALFDFKHDDKTLKTVKGFNRNLKERHKNYFSLMSRLKRIVKRLISKKIAV